MAIAALIVKSCQRAKAGELADIMVSQKALAHECGINRTYLSGVERSERNVSIDNMRASPAG